MAHTRSSKKRVRQNQTLRLHNRSEKGVIKAQIKKVLTAVESKDRAAAEKEFRTVTKLLDRAGTKHLVHKNTTARKKSELAKKVNALSALSAE